MKVHSTRFSLSLIYYLAMIFFFSFATINISTSTHTWTHRINIQTPPPQQSCSGRTFFCCCLALFPFSSSFPSSFSLVFSLILLLLWFFLTPLITSTLLLILINPGWRHTSSTPHYYYYYHHHHRCKSKHTPPLSPSLSFSLYIFFNSHVIFILLTNLPPPLFPSLPFWPPLSSFSSPSPSSSSMPWPHFSVQPHTRPQRIHTFFAFCQLTFEGGEINWPAQVTKWPDDDDDDEYDADPPPPPLFVALWMFSLSFLFFSSFLVNKHIDDKWYLKVTLLGTTTIDSTFGNNNS